MNKIIIFFALLTLSSCTKVDESYKPPNYIKYLKEVEYETIQELKKKGLYISGIGSASMDCISLVDLSFCYEELADISKSRELIVLAVESFLKKINSKEKIRPDLCNYPFNVNNLEMDITLTKNKKVNKRTNSQKVTFVTLKKGEIIYEYTNFDEMIFDVIKSETYLEAKEKVEKEFQKITK